ncbi:hypothetical protein, partial [Anaerotignum lactatifermentans]|uniref:hypothetical protein n=1 Tax=Anaerotignum lactatifermentans TaxID=160404 RepID=UPI002670D19A
NKKKQNEGERRNWGESCTYVQEVTGSSPVTPIFLCPKTKRSKTREKGATGESHARRCKRTRGRACNSYFFMSKNKKKNKGERCNWRELCTNVQEDTRQSTVNPIFLCPKTKRKIREKGATGESMHEGARGHEAERSHSHFLCSTTERNYNQRTMAFYATL